MNKFQRGQIYTIRSHQSDDIYIGSTINKLSKRIAQHRSNYKIYLIDKKNNLSSFEILKYPDHYIELLESFPCANKNELHRREGELIRELDCVNKKIAGRTKVEWRQDNKIEIAQHKKEYRQLNKEKIAENRKEYRQINKLKIQEHKNKKCICPCGGKYTHMSKARHENSLRHIVNFIAC
jgi:hypothetical protein